MKKVFLILTLFCFPSVIWAQESGSSNTEEIILAPLERIELEPPQLATGANGELQKWLFGGQMAPWDGVLLNPPAAAHILSEYEAVYLRALAALEAQRQSDTSRIRLEVGRLYLQLRTEQQESRIRLEASQREIERLLLVHQSLIDERSDRPWKRFLLISSSTIVGIALGIIVGVFAIN